MSQSTDINNMSPTRSSTRSSLLDVPNMDEAPIRPQNISHVSSPSYESPLRHHRRQPSTPRQVKETLHAKSEYTNSEDDGAAEHRINQYTIKQEVGRGSFGAVHLAVDQYGNEYAVKEFSKSRLRKRAQSSILRRPGARTPAGHLAAGGINMPLHRRSASDIHKDEEAGNSLYLIREEIAIMKKLNHPNLVSLLEVLDDPSEDSLYMVLEMCKKGVVMKVGMHEPAEPYDSERCRTWFRDLLLGIEYLHAQGVVHRDIKPDNLLLTEDDILKIVDFGVSEMFEKDSDFMTTKSAGSPAFLPPELCVTGHGRVSGRAADIWSMGVTLHCLYFGRVPFEKINPLELYESIRSDEVELRTDEDDFRDLMTRILEKDPGKRITMPELRKHPWVTKQGSLPLMSEEENTADLVQPPTEEEMNRAITSNMSNLLVVMKAVKRFKGLIAHKRPQMLGSILGPEFRMVHPPDALHAVRPKVNKTQSNNVDDRRPIEQALTREGVHREIDFDKLDKPLMSRDDAASFGQGSEKPVSPEDHYSEASKDRQRDQASRVHSHQSQRPIPRESTEDFQGKGQAHDPLDEEFRFLAVGTFSGQYPKTPQDSPPIVSESPGAAEDNIYETAYHEEVERIRKESQNATLYVTRRVQDTEKYKDDSNMLGIGQDKMVNNFRKLVGKAKEARKEHNTERSHGEDDAEGLEQLIKRDDASSAGLKQLTEAAVKDLKKVRRESEDRGVKREGLDKLAEATVKDLKALQKEKLTDRGASKTEKDEGSCLKSTLRELKSDHRDRQSQKLEDDNGESSSHFKAAVKELKHKYVKQSSSKDESDEMPGLKALAAAVAKDSD